MIPVQPIHLFSYLSFSQKRRLPSGVSECEYLTWEDALWDICVVKKVPKGSIVLVPEFYCIDVINNMKDHGLIAQYYPTNRDLQTDPDDLAKAIRKYNPAIVVVLHAVGIPNTLLTYATGWVDMLRDDQLLIEDCVHSILDTSELKILRNHHYIMDSWRKVMPLQGSSVYGSREDIDMLHPKFTANFWYGLRVIGWWVLFQCLLLLTGAWPEKTWGEKFAQWAETAMLAGYDLVGDSQPGVGGVPLFNWLHSHTDVRRIQQVKERHVRIYHEHLQSSTLHVPHIDPSDYGKLRGYPVILDLAIAADFIMRVRAHGLLLRAELTDCPWSQHQKIVYLPMGPYLSDEQVGEVAKLAKSILDNLLSTA